MSSKTYTNVRSMENISEDEVERTWRALRALPRSGHMSHTTTAIYLDDIKQAISSGLLVPPPKKETQMKRDRDIWQQLLDNGRPWTALDAAIMHGILSRLYKAAEAAEITY